MNNQLIEILNENKDIDFADTAINDLLAEALNETSFHTVNMMEEVNVSSRNTIAKTKTSNKSMGCFFHSIKTTDFKFEVKNYPI